MIKIQNVNDVQTMIVVASMLISLGKATVDQVRALFAADGHDDQALAQIMEQVNIRLARRA